MGRRLNLKINIIPILILSARSLCHHLNAPFNGVFNFSTFQLLVKSRNGHESKEPEGPGFSSFVFWGKIKENILLDMMKKFAFANELFLDEQFGFILGYSSIILMEYVTSGFERNKITVAFFLDTSKV